MIPNRIIGDPQVGDDFRIAKGKMHVCLFVAAAFVLGLLAGVAIAVEFLK